MDPDRVLVAKRLADGVDRHQADLGRVEGVDPHVRGAARVRRPADVAHRLHDAAVVRGGYTRLAFLGPRRRVDHHREVHVVEVSEPQELGLAAQELQLPCPRLRNAPLDIAVLLGRHGQEGDPSRKMVESLRIQQAHRRSQEARDLSVVATGVRRPGRRVALRMAGHDQRIQLTENGEGRPVSGMTPDVGSHAGQGEAGPRGQPELLEGLIDEASRLDLLEPQLGVAADLLAEPDDLVCALVDRLVDPLLQLVPGH